MVELLLEQSELGFVATGLVSTHSKLIGKESQVSDDLTCRGSGS